MPRMLFGSSYMLQYLADRASDVYDTMVGRLLAIPACGTKSEAHSQKLRETYYSGYSPFPNYA